ncbi:N-acetylneuraminate synthase [soil metagenome]
MVKLPVFQIADRSLGQSEDVFIIAEAGVNHNGSLARALEMVDVAAEAGADAVKFQTFSPERLVSRDAKKGNYQIRTTGEEEGQYGMLFALQFTHEQFLSISTRCRQQGIIFLTTPFDVEAVASFSALGVPAVKVSSGDVTNFQLLAAMAATGLPIILSSGMSTLDEVGEAMNFLFGRNCGPLSLLHCISAYPTPPCEANLLAMVTMRERFACTVGFSDHTLGSHIACAAIGLGARILEKHFTLDRSLPGPDHQASLEVAELRDYVRIVREVSSAFGSGAKTPSISESENLQIGRRGLYWTQDLPAGHTITESDLISLRPAGRGVDARRFFDLIGKKVGQSVTERAAVQPGEIF